MWCLTCGGEMQRVQVERDDTMFVAGYEHHTWRCSTCGQSERRLVFISREPGGPAEGQSKGGTWAQAVGKLRDRQRMLAEEAAAARGRSRADEPARAGKGGSQSPPRRAPLPRSPSKLKPVTPHQSLESPGPAPAGALARLAEKLRSRKSKEASPPPAAMISAESQQFDQVWEGVSAAAPQPEPIAAPSASAPLPRSVSLVRIEGEGLVARALAVLSGRSDRRHG